jgi:hypothetical protein
MKTATFNIEDKDYPLFLIMAEKFGATFQREILEKEYMDEKKMYEWAMNFTSDTDFGDVMEWQKNQRKERKLPFRD